MNLRWFCPSNESLAAYADGRLETAQARRVASHITGCDLCLELVSALLKLDVPAPGVPAHLAAKARFQINPSRPQRRNLQWAAATASIVVLASVGIWMQDVRKAASDAPTQAVVPPPSLAASASSGTERVASNLPSVSKDSVPVVRNMKPTVNAPKIIFPARKAVVDLDNLEFRWEPLARSLFYDVEVMSENGDLVWQQRLTATRVKPPRDVSLRSGHKYFVRVRAHLPEGTLSSTSSSFEIQTKR